MTRLLTALGILAAALSAVLVWRGTRIHRFETPEAAIDWLTDGEGIPDDPYLVSYPTGGM